MVDENDVCTPRNVMYPVFPLDFARFCLHQEKSGNSRGESGFDLVTPICFLRQTDQKRTSTIFQLTFCLCINMHTHPPNSQSTSQLPSTIPAFPPSGSSPLPRSSPASSNTCIRIFTQYRFVSETYQIVSWICRSCPEYTRFSTQYTILFPPYTGIFLRHAGFFPLFHYMAMAKTRKRRKLAIEQVRFKIGLNFQVLSKYFFCRICSFLPS